ncbi:hypothetical protein KT99_16159 [Shewanella benthica KT99]|uniref:Uncharacterized protein n=1 Tax=Shewanella benthica KT99 TaxID=314608 RepID=A9D354_9GAMM|nr:hypothetical protein KT99_16159 [Shewanella benthica KT99]
MFNEKTYEFRLSDVAATGYFSKMRDSRFTQGEGGFPVRFIAFTYLEYCLVMILLPL